MRLRERIKGWFEWLFTKPEPVPYTPHLLGSIVDDWKRDEYAPRRDCDEVPPPKEAPMARDEKTSKRVASNAAAALKDPKASAREKSLAGSALTQTPDRKRKAKAKAKAIAKPRAKKRSAH